MSNLTRNTRYEYVNNARVNIDTILDSIVEARISNHVGGYPELALYDESYGTGPRRIFKFRKRSKKEEERYQKIKQEQLRENDKNKTINYDPNIKFRKVFDHFNVEEDNNEAYKNGPTYVCEHCTNTNARKGYIPLICDNCDDCLVCDEMVKFRRCSGCEFSRWRENMTYAEFMGKTVSGPNEDEEIMDYAYREDDENQEPLRLNNYWSLEDF